MEKAFTVTIKHDLVSKGDYLIINYKGNRFGMLSVEILKTMQPHQMAPFYENMLNSVLELQEKEDSK